MPALLDYKLMTSPVGIVRFFEIFLSCTAFSLVAHIGQYSGPFGGWCMFTWCFSFAISVLIVVLELTALYSRIPISWDDFTTSFAMLALLMNLTASLIYPTIFLESANQMDFKIAATAMSCLCFVAYAVEVGLTRAKPGEISGFLKTVPGLLKVLEAFIACIIFVIVQRSYQANSGRQWCMAVYCICFIITFSIIILTIAKLITMLPFPFERFLTVYNIVAVLMYITAAIIWPIFCFSARYGHSNRPSNCERGNCSWDNQVAATVLTFANLAVYIVDLVYSARLVFIPRV
ncbi:myeloid-associated differentiation marker homolog [Carcharodon carcharias]|uniref:myeloid-associated differentiation marker homolog n=1 Tax=Carcharodon carcharias TaxID=13397 RepID=UPI001B7EC28F|nr:myeloid-associated differentiation marker homolog [Carcharodon carcharias]